MTVTVAKVQVYADEVRFFSISAKVFLTNLFPLMKDLSLCHLIQFTEVALTLKHLDVLP